MKVNIGISKKNLDTINDALSIVLASEVTLYTKTRKFHWNVSGESFMELHKLFEAQYTELEEVIDQIAERISKLGGKAIGTMAEFGKLTIIKEHPNAYPSSKSTRWFRVVPSNLSVNRLSRHRRIFRRNCPRLFGGE